MQSVVGIEKEPGEPQGENARLAFDPALILAVWLGLPDDPDAEELSRRLAHLNTLDELTRRRIRKELHECLDDMLGGIDEAVA